MATKKKAAPRESVPEPGALHPFRRRRPVYLEKTFGEREEDTGYEPLWVRYQINLTYEEQEAIPFSLDVTPQDAWKAVAPYVVAWNVAVPDPESGEMCAVDPPSVGGWEVCRHLDVLETAWLLRLVKFAHRARVESDAGKADSTPSGSGPEANAEPT